MFSVLFWNLHGRKDENRERRASNLLESIARLTARHKLDMLVFAECGIEGAEVVRRLNATGLGPFHSPSAQSRRIQFFTRLDESAIQEEFFDSMEDRLSILQISAGESGKILLAGAHFHDRASIVSESGRAFKARIWASAIESVEDAAGHDRTMLVGDLNMNPFEGGLVDADALHAVMTRTLVTTVSQLKARKNIEKSRSFRCFYNPMWGHFGDRGQGPAGTYYYSNQSDLANHFWNIYDQVLLRPGLIDALASLEILESDGVEGLITKNGRPRRATFSDHLPLLVQLDLK